MKLSEKVRKAGSEVLGRGSWGNVKPVGKTIVPKKGKGSYSRRDFKDFDRD